MEFDIYQFILCLVVFILLTVLFTILVVMLVKFALKMIKAGLDDEKIKTEYLKNKDKKPSIFEAIFDRLLLAICCIALFASFGMSISVSLCTSGSKVGPGLPVVNVVRSGSMSYISPNHKYLKEGEVKDQLQKFDIVFISEVPDEFELKVNDIVVYEFRGEFIIHRIVAIEEPTIDHPNQRYFLLQGDANDIADRFPVTYDQIKGIYNGTRIPFIGSFVLFMQSPAGWLCILLVVFAMIATPIAEKKLKLATDERLKIILLNEQTEEDNLTTENTQPVLTDTPIPFAVVQDSSIISSELAVTSTSPFDNLSSTKDTRTFRQKLDASTVEVKDRYNLISDLLCRIKGVRVIQSKKAETYKKGNISIAKFNIKGKTLNLYLALSPNEFENTKYVFTDVSDQKTYVNYPMRVKLTSQRQTKWSLELIDIICVKYGFTILEVNPFAVFGVKKDQRTFNEKLSILPIANERYSQICESINQIDRVRSIDSKKSQTFKVGNTPIVKFTIRGKTLNAYIGLNPSEYLDTKYIFTDASNIKAYSNYPLRVKVSSNRQVKWVKELLNEIIVKNNIKYIEKPVQEELIQVEQSNSTAFSFADLKKIKAKTFNERLENSPVAKERYLELSNELSNIDGVRKIEGKKNITYKLKNKCIVKFAIRGKTLNAYIGLNPSEYLDTKYIFTDVSNTKAYANYSMRVKVSSNRQVKWVKELLSLVINGGAK